MSKSTVEMIREFFAMRRVLFNNEIELQDQIAACFDVAKLQYIRELKVGVKNRLDFFLLATGSAIEIKKRGTSENGILRQLKRYADLTTTREIILVTPRPFRNPPATLSGKPLRIVAIFASMV